MPDSQTINENVNFRVSVCSSYSNKHRVGGVGFLVLLLEPDEVAWAAPGGVGLFK